MKAMPNFLLFLCLNCPLKGLPLESRDKAGVYAKALEFTERTHFKQLLIHSNPWASANVHSELILFGRQLGYEAIPFCHGGLIILWYCKGFPLSWRTCHHAKIKYNKIKCKFFHCYKMFLHFCISFMLKCMQNFMESMWIIIPAPVGIWLPATLEIES